MSIPADKMALVQAFVSKSAGQCKCGCPSFEAMPEVLAIQSYDIANKTLNLGRFQPFIAGHCVACGNTLFFPAQAIPGLV